MHWQLDSIVLNILKHLSVWLIAVKSKYNSSRRCTGEDGRDALFPLKAGGEWWVVAPRAPDHVGSPPASRHVTRSDHANMPDPVTTAATSHVTESSIDHANKAESPVDHADYADDIVDSKLGQSTTSGSSSSSPPGHVQASSPRSPRDPDPACQVYTWTQLAEAYRDTLTSGWVESLYCHMENNNAEEYEQLFQKV